MSSTSAINNEVLALMRAADLKGASPDSGQGFQGEWPPQGRHMLRLIAMHEAPAKRKETTAQGQTTEHNVARLTCEWEWKRDTSDPTYDPNKPPLQFKGESFDILPNYENVLKEENTKTGFKISRNRLLNHLMKMLNEPQEVIENDLAGAWSRLKAKLDTTMVIVLADIQHREWTSKKPGPDGKFKSGVNKTEFVLDLLSS